MRPEIAILSRAREIITPPEKWTTGSLAKNANGASVQPWEESAVCFCALGALRRACSDLQPSYHDAKDAEYLLYEAAEMDVIGVNDLKGHAAVLALFDKALASGEVKPQ